MSRKSNSGCCCHCGTGVHRFHKGRCHHGNDLWIGQKRDQQGKEKVRKAKKGALVKKSYIIYRKNSKQAWEPEISQRNVRPHVFLGPLKKRVDSRREL